MAAWTYYMLYIYISTIMNTWFSNKANSHCFGALLIWMMLWRGAWIFHSFLGCLHYHPKGGFSWAQRWFLWSFQQQNVKFSSSKLSPSNPTERQTVCHSHPTNLSEVPALRKLAKADLAEQPQWIWRPTSECWDCTVNQCRHPHPHPHHHPHPHPHHHHHHPHPHPHHHHHHHHHHHPASFSLYRWSHRWPNKKHLIQEKIVKRINVTIVFWALSAELNFLQLEVVTKSRPYFQPGHQIWCLAHRNICHSIRKHLWP